MTFNSNRVSNANTSTNADYQVANDAIGTGVDAIRYQRVKLVDGTEGSEAPTGTAANPLHVQGTAVGGDVNIAEVGGVAVALGETVKAESIPVTLAGDGSIMYRAIESSKIVDAGTTTSVVVVAGSTTARAGDYLQFTSFAAAGLLQYWFKIASVATPNITLVDPLPSLPAAGVDVFRILRQTPMVTSAGGGLDINITNATVATTDAATAAMNSAMSPAFAARGDDPMGPSVRLCLVGGTNSNSFGGDAATIVAVTDTAPGAAEPGFVTRNIPSGTQAVSAASLPLPTGAATALLQSTVMQIDGVTGENCLRVMGYDVDSSSFNPIPTAGFGTYIPVSISTGMYGAELSNTDALTAVSDTVILNVLGGYSDGTITVSGTYSATMIFEGLSNSVWSEIKCARIDGGVIPESNTGALVSISRTWRVNAAGLETIRVRCSAYVSGSVGVCIRLQSLAKSNQNTSLLPTGQSTMANSTTVAIASDQSTLPVGGNVAHDAADSGSPVKVGARARTSNITAVANDDRVDLIADRLGRQVVQPYTLDENVWHALNASDITNTTSTSIKAATASTRYCITAITVSNLHASVSTRVDILDGSTRIWTGPAAALGGGYSITFPTPLRLTSNTAINAQCGTTGAAVRVAIAGFSTAA